MSWLVLSAALTIWDTTATARLPAALYGVALRRPQAYLKMPERSSGPMPQLLSATGVFSNIRRLTPAPGLIPYDVAVAFWSDGATKERWAAIPRGRVQFSVDAPWRFPAGSVFVKTFYLSVDVVNPAKRRRLETRLLVRDADGGVYGVVYKWRADQSDADLLSDALLEDIAIAGANGTAHTQAWYYPSRRDCLACHNANAGGVLGLKTRQLNRTLQYPSGESVNQLRAWDDRGLFSGVPSRLEPSQLPQLAAADDATRSLEDRARSYLDANCSQCHRPGGTVAYFDARYDTALEKQQIIDGAVLIDEGVDHPRVIASHDIWRSIAYMRLNTVGDIRMPPLARETIDRPGVALLGQWIESLPGKTVLAPPHMEPAGGSFALPTLVTLVSEQPGAEIRYTLDGSEPGPRDQRYEKPIRLSDSAVVRARAYQEGFTHSITAQEIFLISR